MIPASPTPPTPPPTTVLDWATLGSEGSARPLVGVGASMARGNFRST